MGTDASHERVSLPQRLTGFACTLDGAGRILMVRHERLGVIRWELPGGHVDPGESVVDAVARETREEALTTIEVSYAVAEGRHHWNGRSIGIVYYLARPDSSGQDTRFRGPVEEGILDIDWVHPEVLSQADTSPLAWPVITLIAQGVCMPGRPLLFEATHERRAAGWEPVVTRSWQRLASCS